MSVFGSLAERAVFRARLRTLALAGCAEARAALDTRDLFDCAYAGLEEMRVNAAMAAGTPLQDFLKFLIDNQEAIVALIKLLMGLFG